MQKVKITNREYLEIYCPYCGTLILSDEGPDQCEHILFMGFEDSLEYASPDLEVDLENADGDLNGASDAINREDTYKLIISSPGDKDEIICFSLDEVEVAGEQYQAVDWPDKS